MLGAHRAPRRPWHVPWRLCKRGKGWEESVWEQPSPSPLDQALSVTTAPSLVILLPPARSEGTGLREEPRATQDGCSAFSGQPGFRNSCSAYGGGSVPRAFSWSSTPSSGGRDHRRHHRAWLLPAHWVTFKSHFNSSVSRYRMRL